MTRNPNPAFVLQHAWCVFRLPQLQAVVQATISRLEQLQPHELLGRELSSAELEFAVNPISAALAECTNELRRESGITRDDGSAVFRGPDAPLAWGASYNDALQRYRTAAAQLLHASFDAGPSALA